MHSLGVKMRRWCKFININVRRRKHKQDKQHQKERPQKEKITESHKTKDANSFIAMVITGKCVGVTTHGLQQPGLAK